LVASQVARQAAAGRTPDRACLGGSQQRPDSRRWLNEYWKTYRAARRLGDAGRRRVAWAARAGTTRTWYSPVAKASFRAGRAWRPTRWGTPTGAEKRDTDLRPGFWTGRSPPGKANREPAGGWVFRGPKGFIHRFCRGNCCLVTRRPVSTFRLAGSGDRGSTCASCGRLQQSRRRTSSCRSPWSPAR